MVPVAVAHPAGCVTRASWGMAVDAARGVFLVAGCVAPDDNKLFVHALTDGALVRTLGSKGVGRGQFHWNHGGLAMTPRGTVLVAERYNHRLQEVGVLDDGGVLLTPEHVDCSGSVVAVAESDDHRVTLLSWANGRLLRRLGVSDVRQLDTPCGLRLLRGGVGVVVADYHNSRLRVFLPARGYVRSVDVPYPVDVVEWGASGGDGDGDGFSFVVATRNVVTGTGNLARVVLYEDDWEVVEPLCSWTEKEGAPAVLGVTLDSDGNSDKLVVLDTLDRFRTLKVPAP